MELRNNGLFSFNPKSRISLQVTPQVLKNDSATFSIFPFILTLGIMPAMDDTVFDFEFKFVDTVENKTIHKKNYTISNSIYLSWLSIPIGLVAEAVNDRFYHSYSKHNRNLMKNVVKVFKEDLSMKIKNDKDFESKFQILDDYKNSYFIVPFKFDVDSKENLDEWLYGELISRLKIERIDIKNENMLLKENPENYFLENNKESNAFFSNEIKADKLIYIRENKNSIGEISSLRIQIFDVAKSETIIDYMYPIIIEKRYNNRYIYQLSVVGPLVADLQYMGEF